MSQNNGTNDNKVSIICPICQTRFSTKAPAVEFSNSKYVSVVTAAHEKLIRCVACSQKFVLYIADVNPAAITWGAGALTEQGIEQFEGSPIVKPDSGIVVP
jgi:hypothetical protein